MIRTCIAFAVAAFCMLAGSGHSEPANIVFTGQDPDGLILVGLRSKTAFRGARRNWLEFAKYNPSTTGLANPGSTGPTVDITDVGMEWKYFLLKVPPAHYVIRSLHRRKLVHCLDKGTLAFEVEPGKITYIGDIELRRSGIGFAGMEVERAHKAVLENPDIKAVLKPALDIKRTRFSAGGDAAGAKSACSGISFR